MPVLVSAEVPGQTAQGYDAIREHLAVALRQAPGFVLHTSHAIDGGWRVIEIWETKQEANQFFAQHVHPNLPPGIKPDARSRSCTASCGSEASGGMEEDAASNRRISSGCRRALGGGAGVRSRPARPPRPALAGA